MSSKFEDLRMKFVEAIWDASGCKIKVCTSPGCGHIELEKMFEQLGLTYSDNGIGFQFAEDVYKLGVMGRDSSTLLLMLDDFMESGCIRNREMLAGYYEAPKSVGELLHEQGWYERLRASTDMLPWELESLNKGFAYEIAKLAFPDSYLTALSNREESSIHNQAGAQSALLFLQALRDSGMTPPRLSMGIINNFLPDFCGTFHVNNPQNTVQGGWDILAAYSLDFGMEEPSLKKYWDFLPSEPDAFLYSDHGNGYGTGCGFIARSADLFVSQQVWESHIAGNEGDNNERYEYWNICTDAFNQYLSDLMEFPNGESSAMVVFSDFRGDAYIVSSVPESWDEYAPASCVLGPLPDGMGIVGVWQGHDENRYTPRSLDELINRNYSSQITGCAQYLNVCLSTLPA